MPTSKETLSNMVYNDIKNKILHLEFHPKERISEESIAQQTGISRTPIREALRQLSNDGLITIYPKRYAEVAYYDNEMIRQIGTLRLSQDILAAQLAMYYGSDSDFDALDSIAKKCEEAGRQDDVYGRFQLDSEFHLKITEIGQNDLLLKYQKELYLKVHLIQIIKYKNSRFAECCYFLRTMI